LSALTKVVQKEAEQLAQQALRSEHVLADTSQGLLTSNAEVSKRKSEKCWFRKSLVVCQT
jgi:hypothetical protein